MPAPGLDPKKSADLSFLPALAMLCFFAGSFLFFEAARLGRDLSPCCSETGMIALLMAGAFALLCFVLGSVSAPWLRAAFRDRLCRRRTGNDFAVDLSGPDKRTASADCRCRAVFPAVYQRHGAGDTALPCAVGTGRKTEERTVVFLFDYARPGGFVSAVPNHNI